MPSLYRGIQLDKIKYNTVIFSMIQMVDFWKLTITNGNFCFSPCFFPVNITIFLKLLQDGVQNVCDSQMGNTEHFTLMRAFTSQGDLFVLCAKRPPQLLSFCYFRHEGQLLQQLQSAQTLALHILSKGAL